MRTNDPMRGVFISMVITMVLFEIAWAIILKISE